MSRSCFVLFGLLETGRPDYCRRLETGNRRGPLSPRKNFGYSAPYPAADTVIPGILHRAVLFHSHDPAPLAVGPLQGPWYVLRLIPRVSPWALLSDPFRVAEQAAIAADHVGPLGGNSLPGPRRGPTVQPVVQPRDSGSANNLNARGTPEGSDSTARCATPGMRIRKQPQRSRDPGGVQQNSPG